MDDLGMADRPLGFKADDLALVLKRMNFGEPEEGTPEYEAMAEQVDWERTSRRRHRLAAEQAI
jgi:hypothetical protein